MKRFLFLLGLLAILVTSSMAGSDQVLSKERIELAASSLKSLKAEYPGLKEYRHDALVTRLYGKTFSTGATAEQSAETFRQNYAAVFGVAPEDLVPGKMSDMSVRTQPVMYDEFTGTYKFTLFYYTQFHEGIEVYHSELRLLVRNEPGYPLVLAVSTLRDLDSFVPDRGLTGYSAAAENTACADEPDLTDFSDQKPVIFAGIEAELETPRLAHHFQGTSDFPQQFEYVMDAKTGEILHKVDKIIFENVDGTVEGNVTQGAGAEHCEEEAPEPMPFARVNIGATVAYTDSIGNFTVTNFGTDPVDVYSRAWGTWFRVYNNYGSDVVETLTVTPPGPAGFLHNSENTEYVRAQINAYVEANLIRSLAVKHNPTYPELMDTEFPIYVNRADGYCPGNAWYSPSERSINFCRTGSTYPNTAWSSVIHHEYGHHLVEAGGSGQGQYGEGMGDCCSILLSDIPELGIGFFGSCDPDDALRDADNTLQYPCSGGIHDCGQLLSGCIWSTRNELYATDPNRYLNILSDLTINSILLHTGTEITPQITIDFLTLDDTDGDILNGTPHYYEIAAGFGAHNMPAPELDLLNFSYPTGLPSILLPGVATTFEVVVTGVGSELPEPGTGQLHYSVDGGSTVTVDMTELSANHYEATLPELLCFSKIEYYVSAQAQSGPIEYDPGPGTTYSALVATDEIVALEDDFETDLGWEFSGGQWARGVPTGGGGENGSPDPTSGNVGENVLGYNLNGDYQDNMPEYHATSPVLDCSSMTGVTLKFYRWLGVENDQWDHAYVRVSNNGSNWITVWENGADVADNSWIEYEYDISDIADGQSYVNIRFTMGTSDGSVAYCGWNIDHVRVTAYECYDSGLRIVTDDVPDWTEGHPLSMTLDAINVTGSLVWSDLNGDLVGSGLSLSPSGVLSGTPTVTGPVSFTAQVTDDVDIDDKLFEFDLNPAISVTTTTLPDWTAGYAYSQQIDATGGTGTLVITDQYGDLAGTGLTLGTDGLLSGTPNEGVISFTALVTDAVGATGSQAFGFTVNPAVSISTTTLPDALQNEPYSHQLEVVGGTAPLTWAEVGTVLSGIGMILSSDGILSGPPTVTGTVKFTVAVTDALGSSDERLLNLHIAEGITFLTEDVPDWTLNHPYSVQLEASGATGLIWSDKNDDLIGTGLTLSGDGLLAGTPSSEGLITFIAVVSSTEKATAEHEYSFTINPVVSVDTELLPDWTADFAFSQQLASSGGTGEHLFNDKNGDLTGTGLTLTTNGTLSGTPAAEGVISFTAVATDAVGADNEQALSMTANAALAIETESIPDWTTGLSYSQQLTATGGTGTRVLSDKNGDLAGSGLTLSVTGLLEGTLAVVGTVSFTAEVTDDIGATQEKVFAFESNAVPAFTTTSLPDWTVGQTYSQQLSFAGGTGAVIITDKNGDLAGTGLALSTSGAISGAPSSTGPVQFVAVATDDLGAFGEQAYAFTVNEAVSILTESLPDGEEDVYYESTVTASGGTGVLLFSDLNGDLSGTGLSLGSGGSLSGTPEVSGEVSFTAQVEDEAGSTDQNLFTVSISPAYVCADVDGSGVVDIADMVYIVSWMFDLPAGPEPVVLESANVDGLGTVDVSDLVYLVDYMFSVPPGPDPTCTPLSGASIH